MLDEYLMKKSLLSSERADVDVILMLDDTGHFSAKSGVEENAELRPQCGEWDRLLYRSRLRADQGQCSAWQFRNSLLTITTYVCSLLY